jgi:hypothetical protein
MPVTVVGVGMQAPIDAVDAETGYVRMGRTGSTRVADAGALARHDDVVRAFVAAVLAKSQSIGVRGDLTRNYLVSLGVDADRVDVIGCPSLFTWGPGLQVDKPRRPLHRRSRVAVNIDHRVAGMGDLVERNAALYPRLTCIAQDSVSARVIITGRDEFDLNRHDARMPIHTGHPLFRAGRVAYFPSPWAWIEYMRRQRFAFGTRLHGNIAALLAGTPAHLLVHDTRTLELARYHGIPHSLLSEATTPPTAAELYERTDLAAFNAVHAERFDTYLRFLHRNGFSTVFDDGRDAGAFDRSIRAGRRSGPVYARRGAPPPPTATV